MGLIEKLLGKEFVKQLEKGIEEKEIEEKRGKPESQEDIGAREKKKSSWLLMKIGIGMICITILFFSSLYLPDETNRDAVSKVQSGGFLIFGFILIGMPLLLIGLALIIINLFKINKISRIFASFLTLVFIWISLPLVAWISLPLVGMYFPFFSTYLFQPLQNLAIRTNGFTCQLFIFDILSLKDSCYSDVAEVKENADMCAKISSYYTSSQCYKNVAITTRNESVCGRIRADITGNFAYRDGCYIVVSDAKKDPSICEKVIDDYYRKKCYDTQDETADWQTYRNEEYGFTLTLSQGWEGYSVSTSSIEYGWRVVIRNPQWTENNPYEDIPILIYPIGQWQKWEANNFEDYPTAAPIGPSERGRNAQYVFATAPRYNYDFGTGWEDVESIIKTLKSF